MSLDANGWSAIAAWGSVIAASVSLYVSWRSAKTQADMILFEREKHLYELLSADAIRANDNAKQAYPSELNFTQAANVAYALDSARNRILDFMNTQTSEKKDKYVAYFKQQLAQEIICDLNEIVAPVSIDNINPTFYQREALTLWTTNKRFFDFTFVDDEDLSDNVVIK